MFGNSRDTKKFENPWVTCLSFGYFMVECERLSVLFGITLRDWLLSNLLWRSKTCFCYWIISFLYKSNLQKILKVIFFCSQDIECLTTKQPIDFLCWNPICQEEARLLVFKSLKVFKLVCIYVAGLLVVVGGVVVQSDETDRVWSEALFALTCCSSNQ